MGCEGCVSRGLAREELCYVDLIRVMLYGCWDGCHSPLPGVVSVFRFVEVLIGVSSGGR